MRFCGVCGAAFRSSRTCPKDGTALQAATFDPFVGRVLGGRYRVLEAIGAGGMGQVYRAAHTRIACTFAVKVIWGDLAYDPAVQARFAREAEVASCLQSRYIVRVVDFATDEGSAPYLVMEFLDGPTLHDVLGREGALPAARAARIAQRIAIGLAHAHDRGIVHRDLKPENVVLVREDEEADVVKLLDFGVARLADAERLTSVGMALGTPLYMAPEQVRGQPLDGRTDLYALGVLLFEMLAGRPPFDAPVVEELLRAHLGAAPPSLRAELAARGAPPELDDVVQKLLAKKPDDRFASAREVVQALAAVTAPAPTSRVTAPPASLGRAAASPEVIAALERTILLGAPLYNAGDHQGCHAAYRAEAERLLAVGGLEPAVAARFRDALQRAAARSSATDAAWDLRHAFDEVLVPGALARAAEAEPPSPSRGAPISFGAPSTAAVPSTGAPSTGVVPAAVPSTAVPSAMVPSVVVPSAMVPSASVRLPLSTPTPSSSPGSFAAPDPTRLAAVVLRPDLRARLVEAIRVGAPAFNEGRHDVCARVYQEAAVAIVGLAEADAGAQPVEQHLRRALQSASRASSASDAAWVLRRAFDAVLSLG